MAPEQRRGAPGKRPPPQQGQQAKQAANRPTTRVPEKKLVDTRKAGNVNLARYDEHLENLAPERANKMQSGKQKIQSRGNHRKGGNFGNKRRQEEQEKMRRLQLEIAKKTPLTVKIPDEIGVGELASRMKKTGADVVKQLMKLGVMASLSEIIDYDTAALVAMELGCKVEKEVIVTIEEKLIDTAEDKEEDLAPAPRGGGGHGPRGPRQDLPAGLYPQRQCGGRRGWRHHPAHRCLPGPGERLHHHLPRYAWP